MALSNCQVLTIDQDTVIGRVSIDSVSSGNDHMSVDYSLVGPAGPWSNVSVSGGINPLSPPFLYPQAVNGLPAGTQVWVRFQQIDPGDVLVDEEICFGFTLAAPQLTGEICCGLGVYDNWEVSEYQSSRGYGGTHHQCYPPGTGSTV